MNQRFMFIITISMLHYTTINADINNIKSNIIYVYVVFKYMTLLTEAIAIKASNYLTNKTYYSIISCKQFHIQLKPHGCNQELDIQSRMSLGSNYFPAIINKLSKLQKVQWSYTYLHHQQQALPQQVSPGS